MRVVVPAGILIWSLAGGILVVLSLTVILARSEYSIDSTLVLVLFAAWAAVGVDGLGSMDRLWRGPWRRLAIAAAAGLPLVLVVAAVSQAVTAWDAGTRVSVPAAMASRPAPVVRTPLAPAAAAAPVTLARNHHPGVRKPPRWR
jgi:hypothetical protein